MKTSHTIALLLITVAIFVAIFFQNRKQKAEVASAAIPERSIEPITTGTLQRITMRPPGEKTITLTKSEDKWYVGPDNRFEADQAAVNNAINAVSSPIETTVVSTNPDSYEGYHVTETSGTIVQMFDAGKSDPVFSLIIGKDGPSAFTTYVREPNSEEVLNARASLSMTFKRPTGWRNREIFSFSAGSATHIEAAGTSATYSLEKREDKWHMTSPEQVEAIETAAAGIVNMMSTLRATDFLDIDSTATLESLGLQPARQTIHIVYEDKTTSPSVNTTATLFIGNQVDGTDNWYAKRADRADIFMIGNYMAESLQPQMDDLRLAPPIPDPAETTPADQESTATEDAAPESPISEPVTPESEPAAAEPPPVADESQAAPQDSEAPAPVPAETISAANETTAAAHETTAVAGETTAPQLQ